MARVLTSLQLDRSGIDAARKVGLQAASRLLGTALDLVYPPHCMACRTATDAFGGLCPGCWRAIAFIERPFCERLGTPFQQDLGDGLLSPEAMAHPPVFRRARAVALFDDGVVRTLVHRLKYGDRPELATLMGRWMARAAADLLADADVVVPTPLHRGRLWRRQFNQAALLGQVVARSAGRPFEAATLTRVKATATQVGMTRNQRAANVQGAFHAPAGSGLAGRTVLLVDDVLTSGATANAAARALLRGGARAVDLAVFARVAGSQSLAI